MPEYTQSRDGTRIAFERLGDGPPVVLTAGILCDRRTTQPLARQLAERFTVVSHDRRGRGDSGDTAPYAVAREIEDLHAVISETGPAASVYGHSSGAGLALEAAAAGLPITRLVLHEPPYGPDDEESRRGARDLAESVVAAAREDRRADAITLFLADSGLPEEVVEAWSRDPRMQSLVPTMPYDHEVMGDLDRGGTIPEDRVRAVQVPTLVVAGGASPSFFHDTAARIAGLLPHGRSIVLDGHDHGAPAEVVAPVVGEFLAAGELLSQQNLLP